MIDSNTPLLRPEYDLLPQAIANSLEVYVVSALDKARAAGRQGDLLEELDRIPLVPSSGFACPAAAKPSEERTLEMMAVNRAGSFAGAAGITIDLAWSREKICSLRPGEAARFWVAQPTNKIYVTRDGTDWVTPDGRRISALHDLP
jgi:hypothetical protein